MLQLVVSHARNVVHRKSVLDCKSAVSAIGHNLISSQFQLKIGS